MILCDFKDANSPCDLISDFTMTHAWLLIKIAFHKKMYTTSIAGRFLKMLGKIQVKFCNSGSVQKKADGISGSFLVSRYLFS